MTQTSAPSTARSNGRVGVAVRTFPAPERLATRTDLSPDQTRAVTEVVNPLIADALALYVKLKNFHWHLSGVHFRDFHLMCDELASNVLATVDIMAERVRRVGGTTIRSISHVSALQTIGDDNDEYVAPNEMIKRLLGDEEHVAERIRAAIEVCTDNKDEPTANRLEEILDEIERQKWFLFEISLGHVGE